MTTTTESRAPEYLHPHWCDPRQCDPTTGVDNQQNGDHRSSGTTWQVQSNEVDVSVQLRFLDDIHPRTGHNGGDVRLHLAILDRASTHLDGSPIVADAAVDPEDARMLAAILTRYADMAEWENAGRGTMMVPASELLGPRGAR